MSVEQTDLIDAIGVDKTSQEVVLTISDHLEWSETAEDHHKEVLQEKLNAYLRFIESGELVEAYPDAEGRPRVINIVMRCAPKSAIVILERNHAARATARLATARFHR